MILAKLSVIPVRRGYWGAGIGDPHTVPVKVTGKCGSVTARLVPAPRGTGIVAAPVPKKVLQLAGITDCYTTSRGSTKTLGNFVKATFAAIGNTYGIAFGGWNTDYRVPDAGSVEGDWIHCHTIRRI